MNSEVQRKLLGLVGLGVRAGNVVIGVDRVRDAVRRNKVRVAVVAPDASRHSRDKVLPLLGARRVPVVEGPTAQALGSAVGRDVAAVVGVTDSSLAAGIKRLVGLTRGAERKSGPGGAHQEGSS